MRDVKLADAIRVVEDAGSLLTTKAARSLRSAGVRDDDARRLLGPRGDCKTAPGPMNWHARCWRSVSSRQRDPPWHNQRWLGLSERSRGLVKWIASR